MMVSMLGLCQEEHGRFKFKLALLGAPLAKRRRADA